MSTPTAILSMEKTTPGTDGGWGPDVWGALDTMDRLSAGQTVWYVDKAWTAAALGNGDAANRRHFDTIQDAITAAETTGYGSKSVILIHPGYYDERLFITKSVTLCGTVPVNAYGMGAARGVEINGDNTQNPTITVTPVTGGDIAVNLINLHLQNQYNGAANYINKPYLVDWRNDNAVGNVNYFGMLGCVCRNQTWGQVNDWETAFSLVGNMNTTIDRCIIANLNYGGGTQLGGIRKVFTLRGVYTGNPLTNKTSWIQVRNTAIYSGYGAAGTCSIFDCNNGTGGRLVRCDVKYTNGGLITYGATGTNTPLEGCGSDFLTFGNLQQLTFTI